MGMVYFPVAGVGRNFLLASINRNNRCICGSGKKIKKCCLDKIPQWIDKKYSDEMRGKSYREKLIIYGTWLKMTQSMEKK